MRDLKAECKRRYDSCEKAKDFFTFSVFFAALCEKNKLDRFVDARVPDALREAFLSDAGRLLSGYPLQYYLGEAEFCDRSFGVCEGVLIPRADTGVLVREAIRLLPEDGVFYDFCCGSGCIAISVLLEKPRALAVALDVSDIALACTEKNAVAHGVRERLILRKRDLLREQAAQKPADLVLMNPPYIRTGLLDALPENVKREPKIALDGGADGLRFYRAILSYLPSYLKENAYALFEIGFDQGGELRRLCAGYGYSCEILPDLADRDRVAKITLAKNRNL